MTQTSHIVLLTTLFACLIADVSGALAIHKRQTYYYPEDLRHYAQMTPNTRFIQGTVGRYAPQDWPSWYTRTMFKWNGESRLSPYSPNDSRYAAYQRSRLANDI